MRKFGDLLGASFIILGSIKSIPRISGDLVVKRKYLLVAKDLLVKKLKFFLSETTPTKLGLYLFITNSI